VRQWVTFWVAIALHVVDEALTGFLAVYNPTVTAMRERLGWWPMPTFAMEEWILGLSFGVLLLALLTPASRRAPPWFRILAGILAALMVLNAAGHIVFSALGRTLPEVTFPRPAPGFWSSLLLLPASLWLLRSVIRPGDQILTR
jgi:hypothetical protein